MLGNLETDVSTSLAILDRLPADERANWLQRLERTNYSYLLNEGSPGTPMAARDVPIAVTSIQDAIGHEYPLTFTDIPGPKKTLPGSPQTEGRQSCHYRRATFDGAVVAVVAGGIAGATGADDCLHLAGRENRHPPAHTPRPSSGNPRPQHPRHTPERKKGPTEVAYAARAFNAMQARIAAYLKERMQLLAAISHDLQTPITRMKLRAEFMDDSSEKDKLWNDLGEMEHLVREGVAYARSIHGATEESRRTDLDSFLDSLVFDYQDMGKKTCSSTAKSAAVINTRPHALRRVLVNLIDNALKFAGAAELWVETKADGSLSVKVMDRGPGIAEEELAQVMEPFYRVENSRNRSTGGTGLGLAIAQQLALAIGGSLTLSNREGGGLCAELKLPKPQ